MVRRSVWDPETSREPVGDCWLPRGIQPSGSDARERKARLFVTPNTPLKRNFFAWHAAPGPPLENCSSESRYGTHCTPCPFLPAQDLLWASGLPLFDPSQRRRQHRRRATYSRELTAGLSLHTEPPLSLITLPPPRAAMESESGIKAAGVGAAHAPLPR